MSRLSQYRWTFRDMKKFGVPISLGFISFTLPWFFPHVLQLKFDYDGKTLIRRIWDWRDIDIHACYKSPELIRQFEMAEGQTEFDGKLGGLTMKEKLILSGGGLLAGVVLSVACMMLNPPEPVTVLQTVTNASPAVVSGSMPPSLPSAESDQPEPVKERFCSYFECTDGDQRIYTLQGDKQRVYIRGELFEGRQVYSVSEKDKSVTFLDMNGHTETVYF